MNQKSSVLIKPPPPETRPNTFNWAAGIIPKADDQVRGVLDDPDLQTEWNCAHCSARGLIWLDNIGTFQCSFHPLPLDPHTRVHSCCRGSNVGCRRRDHTPHVDPLYPGATVNMALFNGAPTFVCPVREAHKLGYLEKAVARLVDQPDMLFISRLDPAT